MAIKTWIWCALLLGGAMSYGLLEWSVDDWTRDFFATSAATSPGASEPNLQPITTAPTQDAAQRAIMKAVEELEGWEFIGLKDQMGDRILRLTRTSPYLQVVDDVVVTITNHEDAIVIAATSQSRSEFGDFGRNPRNIKELFKAVRASLWRD